MKTTERISVLACLIVLVLSAYSFVTPLFTSSFGLGSAGYVITTILFASVLGIIYKNEKLRSSTWARIAVLISFAGALIIMPGVTANIVTSLISIVAFIMCFAAPISSLEVLGLDKRKVSTLIIVVLAIVLFTQNIYVAPSVNIAQYSPPVLDDNWWNALNWIKNNTPACSVVATYWDPGHFIRGIAERAVVFDGATQGATITVPAQHADGLSIVPYDNGINHIINYKNGTATTARINDIAISLMTSNESLALDVLGNYRNGNCDMYYLATSDLIGKSVWWTYFSTWDPTVSKGTSYSYYILNLQSVRPLYNQNSLVYTYPIGGQNSAFVLIGANDSLVPYLQQGNAQPVAVANLIYYSATGQVLRYQSPDAPVKGTIFAQSDKQAIVYMPEQIDNSVFTKLFLFNGAGLNNFQFVNQWGGEVKLFKVNFPVAG